MSVPKNVQMSIEREAEIANVFASAVASRPTGPAPRTTQGAAPLSLHQETLWVTDRLSAGGAKSTVSLALRLRGPASVVALVESVRSIVRRHRGLQMYVETLGEEYMQAMSPDSEHVVVRDLPDDLDPLTVLHEEARREFDLTQPPLWRLLILTARDEVTYLLFSVHEIAFDDWSARIFLEELGQEYRARRQGIEPMIAASLLTYDDFSEWQREEVRAGRMEDGLRFWKQYLAGLDALDLVTDRPLPSEQTFEVDQVERVMECLGRRASDLSIRVGVSEEAVYVALVATVLDRFSRGEEVTLAMPFANRPGEDVAAVIGRFVNVLPIRCTVTGGVTFADLARQCQRDIDERATTSHVPLERIIAEVKPKRDPSRQPLTQVALAISDPKDAPDFGDLKVDVLDVYDGTASYQLSFVVSTGFPQAIVRVKYNTDIFDEATITSMVQCIEGAAAAAEDGLDTPLHELSLLDEVGAGAEAKRGIGHVRERRTESIPEALSVVCVDYASATAVVDADVSLSYAELHKRAKAVAVAITNALPDVAGQRVALLCERTVDLPSSVLAILQLGAVYVPIDPGNPEFRIREMLEDSGAALLVGHSALVGPYSAEILVLELDRIQGTVDAQEPPTPVSIDASAPAYFMYTSGSTGTPKGVVVSHTSVVNFIQNTIDLFELTCKDRILAYASVGFDVSIFEMFAALMTGASVHYVPSNRRLDMDYLQDFILDRKITVTDLPPSVMSLLEPKPFESLRIVFVGGEPFSSELVEQWAPGRRFFNGYGPTECTVTMIVHECTPFKHRSTPPIGLAMDNHVAHVVDAGGHLAPQGAVGELVVAGSGLALGYHRRPVESRAFVEDWIGTSPDGRLYRTGDMVRRNSDGDLVYIGRGDSQVKVNGVRIEPGEIEWAMRTYNGVRQAHCRVVNGPDTQILVGYYTATDGSDEGSLREHLKMRLVPAMVPQFLVRLQSLPLTASGKVDSKHLPMPEFMPHISVRALRPGVEEKLWTEVYQPVLKVQTMGPEADFFEAGGASLQAAQLISRVHRYFDVKLSMSQFFIDSSIAAVATYIERTLLSEMQSEELAQALAQMSDEDVSRLLGDESGQ